MTEVVYVMEVTGAAPHVDGVNETDLTSIVARYCTYDTATPGTNYPCKVPSTGFYYSYWKTMFLDVSGTFNSIRDIKWYCDGTVALDWGLDSANGGGLFIGLKDDGDTTDGGHGCPLASYQQSGGTPGYTGYAIGDGTNGHAYYKSESTPVGDADDYVAATPLLIDATVYTAAFQSKAWVTQIKIPPTAAHGELTAKSFNVSYQVY